MLRLAIYIGLSFYSCFLFSQTPKPDKLKQISIGDTVVFTVTTSGCFNAGTLTYTLVKLKNNERQVILKKDTSVVKKKLSAKNYDVFVYRFRQSAQRFKYADEQEKKCTLTTSFRLQHRQQFSEFTNTSCEAEFNPEELLKKLMK